MRWPLETHPDTRVEAHFGDRMIECFAERPANLTEMLAEANAGGPQREALVCGEERLTWADVDRRSARIAAAFAAHGLEPGERVALLVGNRLEFVLTLFGALRAGLVTVPLSTRYQTPEIAFAVDDCAAAALVYETAFIDRLPKAAEMPTLRLRFAVDGIETVLEATQPWSALEDHGLSAVSIERGEEETAVILYTSGTTGRPKGAMLSHLNLVNSSLVYRYCFDLGPDDRSIAAVPLVHVTGLVANILAMVVCGGTLIVMPAFKAAAYLDLAEHEKVTCTILVPAMYKLCLMEKDFAAHDLSAWRIGGYGGAPMPEPTIRELADKVPGLKLMNAYGATETSSPATIMPAAMTAGRLASVGLPVPNCEIVVVDDEGREVPAGQSGELWIGGPLIVGGYWNRPDANAASFTGGFWHSGDIGMIDADGFVHVLDRKKDMINRGGLKIYSAEVESVLSDCPGVVESAIVARPCPVLGERVHAFVCIDEKAPGAEDMTAFAAARLSDYKVPETFTISTEPLPRNSNGKVMKRALRDRIDAMGQLRAS